MALEVLDYQVARFFQGSVVIYNQIEYSGQKTSRQKENEKNLTRGVYNGFLSYKTKSKIKKIISPWLNGIFAYRKGSFRGKLNKKPYPTFITLTLSAKQVHDDAEIKRRCLNHFLINLQRNHNVRHYFWIAETQKNGNLHFHVIVDSYIHWESVRKLWNTSQELLGYVSRFKELHTHENPNSTDIHKIEHVDSIESYVMKYVQKGGGVRMIKGRIWSCSKELKDYTLLEMVPDTVTTDFIKKIDESKDFKKHVDENVTVYSGDVLKFASLHSRYFHNLILSSWRYHIVKLYGVKTERAAYDNSHSPLIAGFVHRPNIPHAQLILDLF